MITSGAVTNRIDRLEQRGFVRRAKAPTDKRIVLVQLTDEGYEVIDGAVGDHLDNERRILEPLSSNETRHLERLLRKLERGLSEPPGSDD
jgi:DNA-binding MarR family transcriptional regulator